MFLTASLLAVLASNYAFQTSSQNAGAFNMSSVADSSSVNAKSSVDHSLLNYLTTADKEIKTAEATASEIATCVDCKTAAEPSVLVKLEDYNKLIARINDLEKKSTTEKSAVKPEEDNKTETKAEKRERIKQEKKDKEDERIAELTVKFEDKIDDMKSKCDKDLECLASGFTSVLNQFDGKNTIPASVVKQNFKTAIAGPLSKSLYTDGPESQASLLALQSLMGEVPEKYSGIKELAMGVVSYKAKMDSARINEGYKAAEALSKQNNPQAYFDQINQTQELQRSLNFQIDAYGTVIDQSLRQTEDRSTLAYYQRSFVPDMLKIKNSVMGVASTEIQQQPTEVTTNTRNTRSGLVSPEQNSQQDNNVQNKMTNPTTRGGTNSQPVQWDLSTQPNNFQQGPATQAPTRGGRGRY